LLQEKQYSACRFLKEFWNKSGISSWLRSIIEENREYWFDGVRMKSGPVGSDVNDEAGSSWSGGVA